MDTFVKRIQPERYSAWLNGDDFAYHPAICDEYLPASVPSVQDVLINKNNTNVPKAVLDCDKAILITRDFAFAKVYPLHSSSQT